MALEARMVPPGGLVQADRPGADVQGPVDHSLRAVAGDRHLGLLAELRPARPQGRRLGQDRGVGEEDRRPLPALEPPPEPPLA